MCRKGIQQMYVDDDLLATSASSHDEIHTPEGCNVENTRAHALADVSTEEHSKSSCANGNACAPSGLKRCIILHTRRRLRLSCSLSSKYVDDVRNLWLAARGLRLFPTAQQSKQAQRPQRGTGPTSTLTPISPLSRPLPPPRSYSSTPFFLLCSFSSALLLLRVPRSYSSCWRRCTHSINQHIPREQETVPQSCLESVSRRQSIQFTINLYNQPSEYAPTASIASSSHAPYPYNRSPR